uniref:Uncharacterized protein n=2 Tax=Rhodosorus marinus TaxID=101924 RepID=A0A7S0BEN0_9RHOD
MALTPMDSCGVYCSVKAASDAMHRYSQCIPFPNSCNEHSHFLVPRRSLGKEESETYRVVNYSPGPMATDMLTELSTDHPDTYERSRWGEAQQAAIRPENSARKLMYLLERNEYKDGAHIDFYDLDEDGEIIR